ncbi:MAG TPA: 50S ribosomal protein L9 [Candidatus Cloacimonadota bacterium]|nr:50S ribosomal protein L9 [Candidatus Cloacimonadota bacterium]
MKVILMQHIEKLGAKGDLVNVKRGYARNYLIPRGFAIYATPYNMKKLEEIRKIAKAEEATRLEELKNLAAKINGTTLSFTRKTDEQGNLYGSVSDTDIVNELNSKGLQVHKSAVQLDKHIKELGVFDIELKLHKDVEARIKVEVKKEATAEPAEVKPEPIIETPAVEPVAEEETETAEPEAGVEEPADSEE